MGKRKAAKKPGKKAKLRPLDKVFRCLFCQHAGVVHCKLDRQEMVSRIECSRCAQWFETKIDHLTEPIDVYSLWIDATELANRPQQSNTGSTSTQRTNTNMGDDDLPESPRNPRRRPSDRSDLVSTANKDLDPLDDPDEELPDGIFS
ncbi:hypothetical protein CROQUDRAFT_665981 [Cronartium quercuum f. sp. fusiforme G11]|uniref:Transcription elongation factor 1 homolog n=1 Tax=Cronartium quercuum f. sp. fusiforme G11 TaxID=708437 RepID=A0A9P6N8Q6_9BASI|nr:hypothetical protein CROQUDRAFT_665981 [Cronartium quercuum f. sp. fusiforme G11]